MSEGTHVRVGSKAETVALALENTIETAGLHPGDALGTKAELVSRFGVSPGTLNEALRLLHSSGIIALKPGPGGGVFVGAPAAPLRLRNIIVGTSGAQAELADVVAVRDELEVLVAVEAARRCTPAQAEQLRAQLEVIGGLDTGRQKTLEIWKLHTMIARIGANGFLTRVYIESLETLETLVTDYAVSPAPAPGVRGDTVQVHRALIEAIASGDVDRAREAAIAHTPISRTPGRPAPS